MDSLSNRFSESNIYVDRCSGAWIVDERGNRYVDYLLGNCCHILGHSHPRIVEAIREQAGKCVNVGDHHYRLAYELADKIKKLARKDAVRLVNSGSEAVHLAIRLARGYTNRSVIVKFWGHYHGWFTEEIARFVPELPYDKGLLDDYAAKIVAIEWNDEEQLNEVFRQYGDDIAAVICEPVLCHAGPIPPAEGFLQALRRKTGQNGSLLIFDECITGLRLALGGAQEHYDVYADIVTYSKAFSGGLPIGICAGTAEVMSLLGDGSVYQAATYDANPLSVAVAHTVLDVVQNSDLYDRFDRFGSQLIAGIDDILNKRSVPHIWQGFPSVFQFYYTEKSGISNSYEALTCNNVALYGLLIEELMNNGVSLFKGDLRSNPNSSWLSQWFMSGAHGAEEVEHTLAAFDKSIGRVLDANKQLI